MAHIQLMMKKSILSCLLIFCTFISCKEDKITITKLDKCVSCIAESNSGKIINYTIDCFDTIEKTEDYYKGLSQYYVDHGDTVTVKCIAK